MNGPVRCSSAGGRESVRPGSRRILFTVLPLFTALLGSALGCLAPAQAARFFHGEPRQVRACVLLLPSTSAARTAYAPDGQNLNPYVFYVMDRRTDLRPEAWEFVNPTAPPLVTGAMQSRWDRITGRANSITVGVPLTKDLAPYWEVPLRPENMDRLAKMDICYIGAAGNVRITYQDRELLRRLADAGVLLWFDDAGGLDFPNPGDGPFFPLRFTPASGAPSAALPAHTLLDGIYRLLPQELARLGLPGAQRGVVVTPPDVVGADLADATKPGLTQRAVLTPVVTTAGGFAAVAAAQYGSGFLLATAGNVGAAISGPAGSDVRAGPDVQSGVSADLKLAYNAVAWTDSVTHVLKSPRRTGASGNQLASYLERWSFNGQPVNSPSWLQPLIVRNQVFAVLPPVPNGFSLFSFEVNPNDDFNGDGNPIDGPGGLAAGLTYDQIAGGTLNDMSWISGLAYGEQNGVGYLFVSGGTGGTPEGVSAGTTLIYGVPIPTPNNPRFGSPLRWTPPTGSKDVNVRTVWSAPAYFDGLLIAAGGTQGNAVETGNPGVGAVGDMRALRLENGQLVEQWHYPQGNAPETGPIVGPVVVANIADPRTGATDTTVLYTTLTIASSPGGLGGIVIHTAGEPMTALDDGRTWQPTRRVEAWDPNQWFDIRVIDNKNGLTADRFTPATQRERPVQFNVENQPGRIRLPVTFSPSLFTVVAEYALINTREGSSGAVVRRYWVPAFNPPGGTLPSSGISAGPAVDATGNVYVATGNGYVASLRFVGGVPMVNWKARTVPEGDTQFLGQQHVWEPYKEGRLKDHLFVSTPAWRDDVLYVAGRDGAVYAFETATDFTIKIPFSAGKPPMAPGRPLSVVLYSNEGDTGTGEPSRTNRVPPDAFTVNADAGTVTITNMRNVTLDLSRAVPPERIPAPGLGNRYGIPISIDYTDINGQTQQDVTYIPLNLLYRFQTGVGNGAGAIWQNRFIFESSPVVAGSHVYVIGNQRTSGARNELGPAVLFQLPADPRKLDNGFLAGSDVGAWKSGGQTDTTRPPGWMVDARPISQSPVLAPPAIANDLMVIITGEGITAYKAGRTLVADANRVLEVGTDGRVAATMNATQKLVAVGSDVPIPADRELVGLPAETAFTAATKPLDRPSVVRRLNRTSSIASIFFSSAPTESGLVGEHSEMAEESLLIADTGNNRIVETNPGGKVIWELSSFQDPFRLLAPGETLKLSEPMDVQRWVDTESDSVAGGGPPLLVIHTLIADSGNTRVIEIVDKIRYRQGNYAPQLFADNLPGQVDAQGNPIRWYHVLVWSSQTNAQGLRLRYRTAQRLYRSNLDGTLVSNPGVSASQYPRPVIGGPPFLPAEPYESLTMATVSSARVYYVDDPKDPRYGDTNRNIPQALPGGDSIVFLRSNRTNLQQEPFWQPDPTSTSGFKYVQGTVGHTSDGYPIISEIWVPGQGGDTIAHQLTGVTSVERTLRINPADRFNPQKGKRAVYFLIADAGGVFEFRYDPTQPVDPVSPAHPFPRDHGPRLAWAFTNDDYNWLTGGGNGDPNTVRSGDTGRYVGGRTLTAASARLLTNGQVLIASRTAGNQPPAGGPPVLGGEVFALRINDFAAAPANGPSWRPDLWVQSRLGRNTGLPSITWRAPAPLNPLQPPQPQPAAGGFNPLDIGNTYLPDQPAYADLVF